MMDKKLCVVFVAIIAVAQGVQQQSNYDISRNKLGSGNEHCNCLHSPLGRGAGHGAGCRGGGQLYQYDGFSLRDIAAFFLGGYGQYNPDYNYPHTGPGLYPSGPGYPGQYPGSNYPGGYPGGYPGKPGLAGPPGAHPGCPLCDSSVYSYCSYKEAHDACCCERDSGFSYNCRKADCKYLYANSCQEYNLISGCCCVDVKSAAAPAVVPAVAVVG